MTEYNMQIPTDAEIRAIYADAQRMRAMMMRDTVVAAWGRLRSLFTGAGDQAASAH
ncbi:MAG: RSP_7527 family protein [Pikeienuella sp.]